MTTASASVPPEPAFENPLDALLGYQLRRASTVMFADLTQGLADLALRPAEASVVLLIAANPDITQSDIGRSLGIQRANMAPLTTMLTGRGVIDRTRADGRSHALRLTAEGQALVGEIRSRMDAHEARFFQRIDPTLRSALLTALRQVWMR